MSALNTIREWLHAFPGMSKVKHINVDYYSFSPDENSSIAPSGLQEISRTEDILGNVTVENQYSFRLELVLTKAPGDDVGATANADWLLQFQEWVQEQSIRRKVPVFGDDPARETVKAQNGENEYADPEGTGVYTVLLSVNFIKKYEVS